MRKVYLVLLVIVLCTIMVACTKKEVTLHCDTEGCDNMVTFEVEKDESVDEDWVVFCQECKDTALDD